MNSLGMDYAYNQRDPGRRAKGIAIVVAVHLVLGYVLVSGMARSGLNILKKPLEAVVVDAVIPPPPPPPPPPKETPPPQEKAPITEAPPPPVTPPLTPPPVRIETPPPQPDAAPPSPKAAVIETPPAPDAKAIAASMETEYVVKLRAMLNAAKRYPTGRKASQERPQGKVKIWFTLARNGTLIDSGVLSSSDSNLLDDAALGTVRRATYPPFPANTWTGEEQHKFQVELEFSPPSS